jgi:hypothetical protein
MLSDLSDEEFRALATALEYAQRLGVAPPPGEISTRELAEWFATTPQDMRTWEAAILEKLRHHPVFTDHVSNS